MTEFTERRAFSRIEANCKLYDHDNHYLGRCLSLSGTGISFTSSRSFKMGELIEVKINPSQTLTPFMKTMMTVVRIDALAGDEFEISATLDVQNHD